MTHTTPKTPKWLADELIAARLMDALAVHQLLQAFRDEKPLGDGNDFSHYLTRMGLITPYQARRVLEGEAKKLVLGPYNLQEIIGTGSLGAVYKSVGRADRRHYVVKVLPQRNQWKVRLARKQIELLEQIGSHPAIVPFIDIGTANNLHYLVWPYVQGRTIETIVRDTGPLAGEDIACLGCQLAEALRLCHKRNLAHGFIKPTNVMVGTDGQAKLLDFGVGAILAENNDEMESMVDTVRMAEATASMLECASPELVLEPTILTPAGDQYSLGCTLYFCATGRYPFPGGTMMDKVLMHQKGTPEPIASINPDIPPRVIAIIEQMMQKYPENRFRSFRDLITMLKPFSQGNHNVNLYAVPVDVPTPLPRSSKAIFHPGIPEAQPVQATSKKRGFWSWLTGK